MAWIPERVVGPHLALTVEERAAAAFFRAVCHSALAARFAHAVGDHDLERESLLDRVASAR